MRYGETILPGNFPGKMFHQQGDVLFPFPERGDVNVQHVDAIVQVLSKGILLYCLEQIAIGGSNKPHIHLNGFGGTDFLNLPVFQKAQQFYLHALVNFPDFIQKNRTTVGHFQPPLFTIRCPGKGTPGVSE